MPNPRMNLAAYALLAALPPGSAGPSVQRDGYRMSDENRAQRDAGRAARAPGLMEKAEAKRKRKADKRRAMLAEDSK